ncbi:hypothetical protein [Pontimicrobium sp. IMCC45349]|uniref:hypothetical protein n=1 Tax=Pontimicrobium sp. IMCC45349 TaxID=3391574 RepID=UPI0039A1EF24
MRLKHITTIALSIFTALSFAQQYNIEASSQYEKGHPNEVHHIAFQTAYGFSTYGYLDNVFMDNTKEITITKYDQELKAFDTYKFNLPKLGNRAADLLKVIELENKLVFISKSMDKAKAAHEVYAQVYNNETGVVEDTKTLASIAIEKLSKSGFFQVSISPDNTKIGILANLPFVKKTKEKIKVWVYDSNLNELWKANHTLEFDSERAYDETLLVSNSTEAFILKKQDYHKKTATAHLLKINSSTIDVSLISKSDFKPRDVKLISTGINDVLLGFYWDGKKPAVQMNTTPGDDTQGVFMYDLDSNKITAQHKWNAQGNTNDLKSLKIVDTKVFADDIYILGEKQLTDSEFKPNSTELKYSHTFGPAILINLNVDGTLKKMNFIFDSKVFQDEQKEKGSFYMLETVDGLRLFYNKNSFTISSYYAEDKVTYPTLSAKRPSGSTLYPHLIPHSVTPVSNHNMIYFISKYDSNYWFHRVTW